MMNWNVLYHCPLSVIFSAELQDLRKRINVNLCTFKYLETHTHKQNKLKMNQCSLSVRAAYPWAGDFLFLCCAGSPDCETSKRILSLCDFIWNVFTCQIANSEFQEILSDLQKYLHINRYDAWIWLIKSCLLAKANKTCPGHPALHIVFVSLI